jgi:hypothetical protein
VTEDIRVCLSRTIELFYRILDGIVLGISFGFLILESIIIRVTDPTWKVVGLECQIADLSSKALPSLEYRAY